MGWDDYIEEEFDDEEYTEEELAELTNVSELPNDLKRILENGFFDWANSQI